MKTEREPRPESAAPRRKAGCESLYTILIVTWNGDDLLRECLESLAVSLAKPPHCVVVDNAALDSTRALCRRYGFVDYVPSAENLGFAGGNNLGWPRCKTKYVCLLNNDTRIRGNPFATLVDFMERNPRAAVTQGTMILPRCGGTLDDCGTTLRWYGVQHHRFFRSPPPPDLAPAPVFAAKGAFMMVRAEAVDEAGGFLFHSHFKSYYEETDFCHRAWLSGHEIWFVPTVPVEHMLGATSSKLDNAMVWRQYIANILFSFSANFTVVGRLRILTPFAFVCVAFAALNLLRGRFRLFCAIATAPWINFHRRKELRETRAIVQKIRKLSDHEVLNAWRSARHRCGTKQAENYVSYIS
ncbi:MAG: glycosyltransferase family 2 protein [Kiritimatiellae bacterium]|nr:glycosyltransferase family 2 protein [Kiritimatiellia bacterium]